MKEFVDDPVALASTIVALCVAALALMVTAVAAARLHIIWKEQRAVRIWGERYEAHARLAEEEQTPGRSRKYDEKGPPLEGPEPSGQPSQPEDDSSTPPRT